AALAAASQGRFEAMHARLFAATLDDDGIAAAARESGLEMARFEIDRKGDQATKALAHAQDLAERIGVTGTPTFFINGRRVVGNQPFDVFDQVVQERLDAARALVKSGVRVSRVYDATIAAGLEHVVDPDHPNCGSGGACRRGDEGKAIGDA